jgi:magnesium-protoporphyrin O-methyltransferase
MECHGQCQGVEVKFDRQYVAKKLDEYRRKGPKKTTLALIEALSAQNISGSTLLDIGGGIGDIQHALLQSGATSAVDVEASTAYVEACKAEAERQGHGQRIHHIQGDFVALAKDIAPVDIVTLDRVVCCYPDMTNLVSLSANKANRLYGLVYPRDKWWVKLAMAIYYNLRFWLQRNPFRNFVHPNRTVETLIAERGLQLRSARAMGAWNVLVFSRPAG